MSNNRTLLIFLAILPALLAPLSYILLRGGSGEAVLGMPSSTVGMALILVSVIALATAGVLLGKKLQ